MFITYRAAPGDAQEIEYLGLKLKDGEPVELPDDIDPALVEKARNNPTLEVSEGADDAKAKGALVQKAMEAGVQIDRRWGAARIQQAIDEAQAKAKA